MHGGERGQPKGFVVWLHAEKRSATPFPACTECPVRVAFLRGSNGKNKHGIFDGNETWTRTGEMTSKGFQAMRQGKSETKPLVARKYMVGWRCLASMWLHHHLFVWRTKKLNNNKTLFG